MYFKALAYYCLFMIYIDKVSSNVFISSVTSSPSKFVKCSNICEKTFMLTVNKFARSECSRGCRFYKIADMVGATKQLKLNYSRDACHNSCFESYSESTDKKACNLGCDTMASHKQMSSFSGSDLMWSYIMLNKEIILDDQTGEIMEPEELMVDPALKHQLTLHSMELDKLPLVHKRTLPMNRQEFEKWWADCAFKYVQLPRCLTFSLLTFTVIFAFYFTFTGIRCVEPTLPLPTKFCDQALPLPPKYTFAQEEINQALPLPPKYTFAQQEIKV